ncbi:hypothetical protein VTK56DRAFT_4117 [Thermocarpiscus australiensis]
MFRPKPGPSTSTSTATDPDDPVSKPLPDPNVTPQRPGTSGTEAALKMTRRAASEQLRQAERAERAYRARKRAAAARANYADARGHFRQALEHLRLGLKLALAVVRSAHYVVSEKREARRLRADEAKLQRAIEKRRRLDEKLARRAALEKNKEGEKGSSPGEDAGEL